MEDGPELFEIYIQGYIINLLWWVLSDSSICYKMPRDRRRLEARFLNARAGSCPGLVQRLHTQINVSVLYGFEISSRKSYVWGPAGGVALLWKMFIILKWILTLGYPSMVVKWEGYVRMWRFSNSNKARWKSVSAVQKMCRHLDSGHMISHPSDKVAMYILVRLKYRCHLDRCWHGENNQTSPVFQQFN